MRKALPFDADLIYWTDDITYKAFKPFGVGSQVIISNDLKSVLEQFSLPPHQYYPILMKIYGHNAQSKKYSLLHIHSTFISNTNFSKSEYVYKNLKTREHIKTQVGGFADFESFNKICADYFKEDIMLEPSVRALVNTYDILQGISNTLLVNDRVKEAIEQAGFKGLTIRPFTEYEIRPASQSNGNQ